MRKLSHKAAVSALRDTITIGEANASSGDPRLAAEGRSTAIIAMVQLQIVSQISPETWDNTKLVIYNKGELKDVDEELSNVSADPDKTDGE